MGNKNGKDGTNYVQDGTIVEGSKKKFSKTEGDLIHGIGAYHERN